MSKPACLNSPEMLSKYVKYYFDNLKSGREVPDYEGLAGYLEVPVRLLNEYRDGVYGEEFAIIVEMALDKIIAELKQLAYRKRIDPRIVEMTAKNHHRYTSRTESKSVNINSNLNTEVKKLSDEDLNAEIRRLRKISKKKPKKKVSTK